MPFRIEVRLDFEKYGSLHLYTIRINECRLRRGARTSKHQAARAAVAQLKQLQRDIQTQIEALTTP